MRKDIKLMEKVPAKISYQFSASKPVLAILGGSQGSVPFNHHFKNHLEQYIKSNIQILWQCGNSDYSELKELNKHKDVRIIPFIKNMSDFYSAADLIVSRAGALALSEMAFLGKAMVLIPLPNSAGNHQTTNAETFLHSGGAVLVRQALLASGYLEQTVMALIRDSEKIKIMEINSKKNGIANATEKITAVIMEIAES